MGWIDDLMEMTADLESPRSYFYWAGLATISAVVKNRVYIRRYSKLGNVIDFPPNIYVLLYGPSGTRKGVPIMLARNLCIDTGDVKMISGRNSIQGIIKDMSQVRSVRGQGVKSDSTALIIASEFASSLVQDPQAMAILTDLHDGQYHREWKNTLKYSAQETLKNVNLTMLGGINEAMYESMMKDTEIRGGFIARSAIISETARSGKNLLLRRVANPFDMGKMVEYLKALKQLKGEFAIDDNALTYLEDWYDKYAPEDMDDKTGTAMRLDAHVLKLTQLIALSRAPELRIKKEDAKEAIEQCEEVILPNVKAVTAGAGEAEIAKKARIFLRTLMESPGYKMNRQKMLRKHYGDFDSFDLNRIVDNLVEAGILLDPVQVQIGRSRDMQYEASPSTIRDLTRKKKEN